MSNPLLDEYIHSLNLTLHCSEEVRISVIYKFKLRSADVRTKPIVVAGITNMRFAADIYPRILNLDYGNKCRIIVKMHFSLDQSSPYPYCRHHLPASSPGSN
jgi:hypothetical protein